VGLIHTDTQLLAILEEEVGEQLPGIVPLNRFDVDYLTVPVFSHGQPRRSFLGDGRSRGEEIPFLSLAAGAGSSFASDLQRGLTLAPLVFTYHCIQFTTQHVRKS
jgi:hypothetical protein